MKINEKDRGQLLRMAGNIACGMVQQYGARHSDMDWIAKDASKLAFMTMDAVDKEIELANEED